MTTTISRPRLTMDPWRGWIRAGSGFLQPARVCPGGFESGAAQFSLPDPAQAKTTSWASADGNFCVFTGYLYNRPELAGKYLGASSDGRRFSPAETALAAYRAVGSRVVEKLEGSFAVAIWDPGQGQLLCGRDPIGLHPFFYSLAGDEIIFSWDMDAVLAHPAVSREFHPVAVAEHLVHHWWNPDDTLFRDVRRLPAGHALTFRQGRLQVFRSWDPVPADQPVQWVHPDEVGQFPVLLRNSVRRVMEQGNGRAGIFLSGGLDSVSVACEAVDIAAQQGWNPPHALSVNFPAEACEEPIQRAVAQKLGLPQTFTTLSDYFEGSGLLTRALAFAGVCPSPPTFPHAPAYHDLLKAAQSAGCEVVMTGDGGDEGLGVAPIYLADLMREGRWSDFFRMIRMAMRYGHGPVWKVFYWAIWSCGLRVFLRDWAWRRTPRLALWRRRQLIGRAFPAWLAPDPGLRRELIGRFEQHWDVPDGSGTSYLNFLYTSLWTSPVPQIAFEEEFYRNALIGIPTLDPYWDRPVFDFLLRTPPEILTMHGQWKSLVRSRVAAKFPGLGFEGQRKQPATDFIKGLLRRESPRLWQDLGKARMLAALGVVDLKRYHAMLEAALASHKSVDRYRPWHGAGTEQWLRCRA